MPLPVPDLRIEQLNLEVAGPCNLQCVCCPQAAVNGGREKSFRVMMTLDEFKKVVDEAYPYRHPDRPLCISLHGSGEPTLNRHLPDMIAYAKSLPGIYVSFFTHGNNLHRELAERVVKSGIDEVTISLIGYDRETYTTSMKGGNFDRVMANIRGFQEVLVQNSGQNAKINTRHLVLDPKRKEWEVQQYRDNIITPLNVEAEIWLQHNWDGSYNPAVSREEMAKARGLTRRSCGRPAANYLEVRAGGLPGHKLAVVACPIVLGRDAAGTLGHLDSQTIAEVVASSPYENLRKSHDQKLFDGTFCEGCDYLYPDLKEALVWTNKPGRKVGQSQTATSLVYPDATREPH